MVTIGPRVYYAMAHFGGIPPFLAVPLTLLLTVGTTIGNPLDAGFAALTSQDAYLRCVEILLDDPGIDLLLLSALAW